MAVTVTHSTPADGTFSATGAAAWNADHNFTGTIDVTNGGTGATTLTANALLKGNGTSAISASSLSDDGTLLTATNGLRLNTTNRSAAAWTTSGINLIQSAATFTDTTSTGTVADVRINQFNAQTVAASNTITISNLYGSSFANPVAGTNVTATAVWAVRAESLLVGGTHTVSGTLNANGPLNISGGMSATTGTINIGSATGSQTLQFGYGVTASGAGKAINIGTGGASGSTTAITIGSATSGATQTTTVNGRVTLAPIGASAAAWTTSGIGLVQSAATFTDTTSTGTVAAVRMNNFAAQTLAASNTMTATLLFGSYFTNPLAGTNVTASSRFALGADSIYTQDIYANTTLQNNTNSFISNTTVTVTANIGAGVTASGNTKTVNIGTGGASGSTTNITLGSSTSGATQTTTVNGQVTLAPIGGSAAAWTTSGIALRQSSATWTDTTSTGSPAQIAVNSFAAPTVAATNVITPSYTYNTYFAAPINGTNVTAGFRAAVGADTLHVVGTAFLAANADISSQTTTATVRIAYGATASGQTKTVNIGTGGASGSTTNISIGSATSGAASTTTLNGKTAFTGTAQLQGYTVATLPAGTQGMTAFVTDALAPTWNTALVGGGAVVCKAFYNGTAWVAG